jgi:hypothetical protein
MRVVVFVAMVGTRFGDSGGDATLKSRPHTTPNGHRTGSAAGHPAAGGELAEVLVVGEVAEPPVVGEVAEVAELPVVGEVAEVAELPVVGEVAEVYEPPVVGEVAGPPTSRLCALPWGVPIPRVNDAAHSARTLAVRTDRGCRSGRGLSRIRRMRITPLVVRHGVSSERGV